LETASLQAFLSALYPLAEEEMNALTGIWKPFSARRKTVLTASGETERYLYFVQEGVQRAFHITPGGREATIVFTYPPSFSGVADSFLTGLPSRYYLETLTASSFLRTSRPQLQEVQDRYPAVQQLLFTATAHVLRGTLERQIELQCYSAEDKFRALLKRSPHVLNLIPHKYLANYLGLDPATFSKLLGTIRVE
jgi:CRP-like cAMP-binding protein